MPSETDKSLPSRSAGMGVFAVTIFLGAWLVFQIQPVMSKLILPWYGGSPNVWTVCLLFFQSVLFGGYALAFSLARWVPPRGQVVIYAGLLSLALLLSPVRPDPSYKPDGAAEPTGHILKLLAIHIGAPYLLLCATGPLIQDWFRRSFPGRSPYRLYSLSNLGSLLGLLMYPFLVEVFIPASLQATLWRGLFLVFLLAVIGCARWVWNTQDSVAAESNPTLTSTVTWFQRMLWFGLALVPTLLLPAITNRLTQDIGGIPFLWIIPLTIYLISLIWCFSSDGAYQRKIWGPLFLVVLFVLLPAMFSWHSRIFGSLPLMLLTLGTLYGTVCMICHGELARLKPLADRLTEFYLVMSAGGATGGLLTGWIAPMVLPFYIEFHLGMLASYVLFLAACYRDPQSRLHGFRAHRVAWYTVAFATIGFVFLLTKNVQKNLRASFLLKRNFYGVLRVEMYNDNGPFGPRLELVHGDIRHGVQYLNEENQRMKTSYYDEKSGVGLALLNHHAGEPLRVGLIGLGSGTLAAYGRPGDVFDFYEINPAVIDIAEEVFTNLGNCPAEKEIILGDARLNMERLPPKNYDIIAVDAFSGDAIPVHLLTEEAFEILLKHLKPDGILAVHISNKFFSLQPILNSHAKKFGLTTVHVHRPNEDSRSITASSWVLMSRDASVFAKEEYRQPTGMRETRSVRWTDDFNSPFSIMKFSW